MVFIVNLTKEEIDKKLVRDIAKIVLMGENIKGRDFSVVFANSDKIKELNKKFRKKNYPTDVLSFNYESEELKSNLFGKKEKVQLGEIVVSPFEIKKNAKKYNIDYKKELTRVLIHGTLHLLGYDHERDKKEEQKMRNKEEKYLSAIKF